MRCTLFCVMLHVQVTAVVVAYYQVAIIAEFRQQNVCH